MTRTRVIKEELYILIHIPYTWGCDGITGSYEVPAKVFYDEPFTTEETAEMYLALAKKEHKRKPHHLLAGEPVLETYWKVLSAEIKDD